MRGDRQAWSKIAEVLGTEAKVTAKVSKGLRLEQHFTEVTYRLECGHVVVRTFPRLKAWPEERNAIRCEFCSAAANEVARASA